MVMDELTELHLKEEISKLTEEISQKEDTNKETGDLQRKFQKLSAKLADIQESQDG
jgi:hypothetical protein